VRSGSMMKKVSYFRILFNLLLVSAAPLRSAD
jgi:hypothetical protein